jgi:adenylate cyclase
VSSAEARQAGHSTRPTTRRRSGALAIRLFGQRRLTLRVTILSLMLAILLATVLVIAGASYLTTRASLQTLGNQYVAGMSQATTHEIHAELIQPAEPTLEEVRTMVQVGLVDPDDPGRLGSYLIERLRFEPGLDWLYHGDAATGRFTAASKLPDGRLVLTQSAPDVDDGRWRSFALGPDGERSAVDLGAAGSFDPRERPWYRQAATTDGVSWLEPYLFFTGQMGITATAPVRDPASGALRGAFAVDLVLDQIATYLAGLSIGRTGRVILLGMDGRPIQGTLPADSAALQEALSLALGGLPGGLAALRYDEAVPVDVAVNGVRYVAVFTRSELTKALGWTVAVVVPEDELLGAAYENTRVAAVIGLLALVLAVVVAYLVAHRIAEPLREIAADLERVGQFQLSAHPSPPSIVKEVAVVSDAVDRMKASLRSFGRYVPTELVRDMLARGEEARLGGETRCLTIHFSDIEGFTSIAERMEPAAAVQSLAEYLDVMTTTIRECDGTIDKFMGDGIMAFFNAPNDVADHAAQACQAALRAQARLADLRGQWAANGQPVFRARIGLHTGRVLVGNIGTPERFAYTAIGDAANLASRLEGLNKAYGTYICASEEVQEAAGPAFEWRRLDRVAVVGRSEGTLVYELLGERGKVSPAILRARDLYEQALAAYFARQFAEAATGFHAAADGWEGDRAADIMARRAEDLAARGAAPDWDGVYISHVK